MNAVDTIALPSGDQFEVALDDQRLVVTQVGATLRAYANGAASILDGFDENEMSSAGRGQVLAPWPNRLEDGRYTFEGKEGSAALDEPAAGNAIHGLVRWAPWQLVDRSDRAVELALTLHPQPAYPWLLYLAIRYELRPAGLVVTIDARNDSASAAPFGAGFHPYLTIGTDLVDDVMLTIPAERWIATDDRSLPVEERSVAGGTYDFRSEDAIGERRLDTAFAGLRREPDGLARVTLRNASAGHALSMWMDEAFRYVQVYTGDTLEPVERRRRGVAIEPMTCPANALRTGTDLIRLEPGATWRGNWGIDL
jgi:aldose 1-epimerase